MRLRSIVISSFLIGLLGCATGQPAVELPNTPMGMGQIRIEPVTNDPAEEGHLRISPEGDRLLFNLVSEQDQSGGGSFWDFLRTSSSAQTFQTTYRQTAIAMMELGSPGKSIVSQEGAIDPAWYPAGGSFAFSMFQGGSAMLGHSTLGEQTAAVQFISPTPCTRFDRQPSIAPSGQRVLFMTQRSGEDQAIATMSLETTTEKCTILFPGIQPQWAPGQDRFTFTRVISGNHQVFVFEPETNNLKQITFGEFDNRDPTWSPDGTRVAFASNRNGDNDIYVMSDEGTGLVQVTQGPTSDRSPAWSSDGHIYFVSDAGAQVDIWRARIEDGGGS